MSQGTEGHLEHAEHAQHAAHDPFDRRVAMTMTIVAAVLACVTMLSHRAHNDRLALQNDAHAEQTEVLSIQNEVIRLQNEAGDDKTEVVRVVLQALDIKNEGISQQNDKSALQADSNKLMTQVDTLHTKASDQWSYFQAKKNRQYLYEACAELLSVTAKDANNPKAAEEANQFIMDWKKKTEEYQADTKNIEKEARGLEAEAKKLLTEDQKKQQEIDKKQQEIQKTQEKAQQKQAEIQKMLEAAQEKKSEIQKKQQEAQNKQADRSYEKTREKSHQVHLRANRYDYSELGLEMALILCSVAVLTKQRAFWFSGMVVGLVGLSIATTGWFGLFMPH